MKKLMTVFVAAMLVFSLAGQAAAYFEDFKLIRSIWDTSTSVEVGSDLGAYAFNSAEAYGAGMAVGDAINTSIFANGVGTLNIGYWAHGQSVQDFWVTGLGTRNPLPLGAFVTDGDGLQMGSRKQSNGDTVMNAVQGTYGSADSTVQTVQGLNSYYGQFEKSGISIGSFGTNMNGTAYYEVTLGLADLLTVGYVDQLLYYFNYDGSTTAKNGVEVALVRTALNLGADGVLGGGDDYIYSVINPNPVPIPGSVLLLGSALLGLFGIRRKRS
ncbi:MAG: hypothetical protein JXL84_24325 [Deltaproteobacteria bacterium]|nr:hypothetical protein [Deltaproteobacteria bacterium]